jgi:NAD(P)-dependent dehydrogenase (short-subunit alcohol dehydrogenase family)
MSLAREGARVAICARRPAVLEAAAVEVRQGTGGEVLAIPCDVRDEAQVRQMVDRVAGEWGQVDILVNNAGTSAAARFDAVSDEMWDDDLQLKVYGAIYCSRAALPYMQQAGWGRIINITTPFGKAAVGHTLPTSLSRAAGIAMTNAMSKDYASEGILVNTVCIGLIKSGQHEHRWERAQADDASVTLGMWYERMAERVPLGRVGEASEAGDLICFLASERASFISGTAVNVDGGMSPVV